MIHIFRIILFSTSLLKLCFYILEEIKKKNSNVDVAFTVDASGSMDGYIKAVKNGIKDIAARIHKKFNDAIVRVAFIAYRDNNGNGKHFEILDFTESIEEFSDFVRRIRANGGGDKPEDVLGAINKTIHLNWMAANRLFYQIGKVLFGYIFIYDIPCLLFIPKFIKC